MHSALVVVQKPEVPFNETESPNWRDFLADLNGLKLQKPNPIHYQPGVQWLAENVWLVDFQMNPDALAWLVVSANRKRLRYGILQLDGPPRWTPSGFVPAVVEGE